MPFLVWLGCCWSKRLLHTDIDIKTSYGGTALHHQAQNDTTGTVKWLLRQDPPPDIDIRDRSLQWTPLMDAARSDTDPEGKVCLLIEYGANRDLMEGEYGATALVIARQYNMPAAVIDILENYRPDVSR